MLKLGEKIISDIYLGDKKIAKVFLGDKLVYQAGKPIFLEYISFDGNSWIDTGIEYQTCTAEITVKYYEDNKRMLNGWSDQPGCYWGMYTDGRLELGTIYLSNTNLREKTTVNISLDSSTNTLTATVNGESISRSGTGSSRSYWIGATTSASSSKVVGEVYGNKFWNTEGELIQDLRPCIHPNGTVCFYDMVTKKYFYNQGTGTLKAGGRFVESIVSDGNCYINTGIKASYDYTIKTKYMYTSFVGAYNCIFGTRSQAVSEGNKIYWVGCNSTGTKDLMLRMGKTTLPYSLKLNEVIDLEITPNEAIINGTNLGDAMFDGEIGFDSNIYLFNINMGGDGSTALFASVAIMYIFQIYNNNMELIQDLRPYVDADGVACFKDLVTNTLFYNQGTGTLTYTEV